MIWARVILWAWPFAGRARRAARQAFEDFYGVPYDRELSRRQHRGMLLLEARGEVERDPGLGSGELHWHRRVGTS